LLLISFANCHSHISHFATFLQSIQKAIAALVKVVKAFKIAPLANVNLSSIQCSSGREAMERLEELPRPVQTLLQSSAIVLGLSLLFGATGGIQKPVEPLNSPSEFKLLNASQKAAVKLGLEKQISLVRGPPGTGKTSTIAAFAGAVTAGGGRVLIIAPANAATLRALESIVAQDLRSVALVASQEWMLEW
jgi:ATP-dependent 26S proteasome regulatory subunit